MASVPERGKFHTLFTLRADDGPSAVKASPLVGGIIMVGGIAIAMFVALVGFGGKYFGWNDPDGKIQLALVTAFILGIIGGFKSRG
jgi:hypothetical protein